MVQKVICCVLMNGHGTDPKVAAIISDTAIRRLQHSGPHYSWARISSQLPVTPCQSTGLKFNSGALCKACLPESLSTNADFKQVVCGGQNMLNHLAYALGLGQEQKHKMIGQGVY